MRDAAGYVAYVKALIVANTEIVHSTTVREETQGDVGLFRYRLELQDGGLLEIFERFQIAGGSVQVTKYSFHWQDATGNLRKR